MKDRRRDSLDIAALSIAMNQAQVKQQASVSVMKSAMSTAEEDGDALIKILETATPPHPEIGTTIDIKA